MDWTILVAAIVAIIQECLKNQTKEQVRSNMRNSGPIMRFKLRREFRKLGVKLVDLRDAVQDAVESLAESSDGQLDELIGLASE